MDELRVNVEFSCADFDLRVRWWTDPTTLDEVRAEAAGEWFCQTYGMNPADFAETITVIPADID